MMVDSAAKNRNRKKLLLRTGMAVMMKMAIIPETASMTRMVIM